MNRNVEIKARVADPDKLLRLVQNIADSGPEVLNQEDVFFQCPSGRLKLRTINGKESQLIFYVRDDNPSPKASEYALVPVSDPAAMRRVLELALGTRGIVGVLSSLRSCSSQRNPSATEFKSPARSLKS
jgi:adenylate cyclase class IV